MDHHAHANHLPHASSTSHEPHEPPEMRLDRAADAPGEAEPHSANTNHSQPAAAPRPPHTPPKSLDEEKSREALEAIGSIDE